MPELIIPDWQCLRRLRFVPRWCIVPHTHRQNVAEHSFHVAWITMWLCDVLRVEPTVRMLQLALTHDQFEAVTGDLPASNKARPDGNGGPDLETCLVKLADYLEALAFVNEEQVLAGNGSLAAIDDDIIIRADAWVSKTRVHVPCPTFTELGMHFLSVVNPKMHPGLRTIR